MLKKWCFDAELCLRYIRYQNFFSDNPALGGGTTSLIADFGRYILDKSILLIMGASFINQNEKLSTYKYTLYPGVALEFAENYVIVLASQHDFAGRNMAKANGYSLTLTLFLD